MALVELVDDHGAKRARLEEHVWAHAVGSTRVDLPAGASPLDGVPEDGDGDPPVLGRGLRAATRLLAAAPVRIGVSVASADGYTPGLTALVATDGRVGVRLMRRLPPGPPGRMLDGGARAEFGVLPGVEISAFTAARVPDEVVGLLPPSPGAWRDDDGAITLPLEAAVALQRELDTEAMTPTPPADAGADGQQSRLDHLLTLHDLETVPRVLATLDHLRADATVSVLGAGSVLGRLVCGSVGWVQLTVAEGQVVHEPVSRPALEQLVAAAVSVELTRALPPAVLGRSS